MAAQQTASRLVYGNKQADDSSTAAATNHIVEWIVEEEDSYNRQASTVASTTTKNPPRETDVIEYRLPSDVATDDDDSDNDAHLPPADRLASILKRAAAEATRAKWDACEKLILKAAQPLNEGRDAELAAIEAKRQQRRTIRMQKRLANPAGPKPYECEECGRRFGYSWHLKGHLVLHSGLKPHPCSYCPQRFTDRGNKRAHERLHTGERPFECDLCKATFVHNSTLKAHRERHHANLNVEQCPDCYQTMSAQKMITHRRLHTGERPFSCQDCSMRFISATSLAAHKRKQPNCGLPRSQRGLHAGDPFDCRHCSLHFTSAEDLATHRRKQPACWLQKRKRGRPKKFGSGNEDEYVIKIEHDHDDPEWRPT